MSNPWLGLSSYSEDSLSEYRFCGRSMAIATLASLIRDNLFVTLYGRSGVGKTSLLQAGVFPVLRREGMEPLAVRLKAVNEHDEPASNILWRSISFAMLSSGYRYEPYDHNDVYNPDFGDVLVLRKLFSAGRFIDAEGNEALPVIVIDQFEEVLYAAPVASRLLISQLYALIDDNYDLNVSHPGWHEDTNFRLVLSLREDDLYVLEDFVDTLNCFDFKLNRYHLLPLSPEEAREVITEPGKGVFEPSQIDEIVDKIIRLACGNGQNINTLMLSLICYVLYNDHIATRRPITVADIANHTDVVETYYLETVKALPKDERYYLEDHLVDDQGRRLSVYLSDLEENAPRAATLADNGNHRILNIRQGRVEFIHDQLALGVAKLKEKRKKSSAKAIWLKAGIFTALIFFLFCFHKVPEAFVDRETLLVNRPAVADNVFVEHLVYNDNFSSDIFNIYGYNDVIIDDCPNLKSIDIGTENINLKVSNCPGLTAINVPDGTRRYGEAINCPNLPFSPAIFRHDIDIANENPTEKLAGDLILINDVERRLSEQDIVSYDSATSTLTVRRLPVIRFSDGKVFKIPTGLPDSVKRHTVAKVPYGYKRIFGSFVEYQPFASIEELPIYQTWGIALADLGHALYGDRTYRSIFIITFAFIFLYFTANAFIKYKAKRGTPHWCESPATLIVRAIAVGVGMVVFAAFLFVASYGFILYINSCLYTRLPDNILSQAIWQSFIFTLLIVAIAMKNNSYAVLHYIDKNTKSKNVFKTVYCDIKRICNNFMATYKRNPIKVIAIAVLIAAALIMVRGYTSGYDRRCHYIENLNRLIADRQYVKALSLVDTVETRHASLLYPEFSKEIADIRRIIDPNNISLLSELTPKYIGRMARNNSLDIDVEQLSNIIINSDNASEYILGVLLRAEGNDIPVSRLLRVNLALQKADTLPGKLLAGIGPVLSPSGKRMIAFGINKAILYELPEGRIVKTLDIDSAFTCPDKVVMLNDSVYCCASFGRMFKQNIIDDPQPLRLGIDSYCGLARIDDSHIAYLNQDRLQIYDIEADRTTLQSEVTADGGTIYGNSSGRAVLDMGILAKQTPSLLKVLDTACMTEKSFVCRSRSIA